MSLELDHLRLRGRLRPDLPLAPRTWFRVGGSAEGYFEPADSDDLQALLSGRPDGLQLTPLGVASNVLIRDGGLDGLVVRLSGALAMVRVEGTAVVAGAGASDRMVAIKAAENGIAGLEFLIGIPGTIGGAVKMNAGAFGGEIADRVLEVTALDPAGRTQRMTADELDFAYRHSSLPDGWIVTEVVLEGVAGDREQIRERMHAIKAEREATQPLRVATGGSTFKNPPGDKAWRLIDAAGCRGLRLGQAMVSEKHCNFLVNLGDARAADIERLGERVRERVLARTGVTLDWEIHRLGRAVDGLEAAA
ncbi:MAG: UDP-N-acetylmuramate dehydrogenase [Geminicoccaceae bacterium]|nr:UDP-N-acetylmuramate dehydrogenase [Geminicoccaceae bacterium]